MCIRDRSHILLFTPDKLLALRLLLCSKIACYWLKIFCSEWVCNTVYVIIKVVCYVILCYMYMLGSNEFNIYYLLQFGMQNVPATAMSGWVSFHLL